ncbi:MAG: flagellar biosynthesis protein FlhF [Gammaproteobacteria bacterium]|nr:flagellar biosynthesis protein FlhF [Gammaproteobacteria bacterium]
MKIKRYYAKDMRTALAQVKEELGSEAVIMSNKKTATGIEIVAAVDNDSVVSAAKETANQIAQQPQQAMSAYSGIVDQAKEEDSKVASSLQELLNRQTAEQTQQYTPSPITSQVMASTNKPKSDIANKVLSEQAESEFEQWLSKARTTVLEQETPSHNVAPELTAANETRAEPLVQNSFDQQESFAHDDFDSHLETSQASSMTTQRNESNVVHGEFDREIASLKSEMHSIKELLEHQVSELMWQDMERKSPTKAMLINKLKDMGLSEHVSEHLTHFLGDDVTPRDAWTNMLELLKQQLDTTSNEVITRGGIYSLVGPTGVGKTTTIAKLAARYAQIHGADTVGLISTDTFRIGALEQLATYAKILGCPLKQAKNTEELSEAIYQLRNKKLVLIDTAGMSQRDLKLTERLNNLLTKSRVRIKNYLVLSATSQMSVLQESVQHFKTIPLSGCVFTKIDESLSLGELMSVAIHNRLPIGYLTNGQRVPEDIRVANSEKIVQKANQLFELKQKVRNKNNRVVPKAVGMYD